MPLLRDIRMKRVQDEQAFLADLDEDLGAPVPESGTQDRGKRPGPVPAEPGSRVRHFRGTRPGRSALTFLTERDPCTLEARQKSGDENDQGSPAIHPGIST